MSDQKEEKKPENPKHKGPRMTFGVFASNEVVEAKGNKCFRMFKKSQQIIYIIYDDPSSSILAKVINIVVFSCIMVSVILVTVDSVDSWSEATSEVSNYIEIIVSVVFVLEYLTRFYSCTAFGDRIFIWPFRPFNLIDLVSLIPFFMEIGEQNQGLSSLIVIRSIKLTKMFRIVKLSKYMAGLDFLHSGLMKSLDSLGFLLIILLNAVLVMGTAFYYVEYDKNCDYSLPENQTRIKNIVDGLWLALVTMATVGYGDYFPHTILGKLLASVAAILGMLVIALPVAILGSNFQDVYKEKQESKLIEDIKAKIIKNKDLLTEEQKEIHFMNERLMNIQQYNKKITKLLLESSEKYKNLKTKLKDLYKEIYREIDNDEFLDPTEKLQKNVKAKINRVKAKVKISNILRRPKPQTAEEAPPNSEETKQEEKKPRKFSGKKETIKEEEEEEPSTDQLFENQQEDNKKRKEKKGNKSFDFVYMFNYQENEEDEKKNEILSQESEDEGNGVAMIPNASIKMEVNKFNETTRRKSMDELEKKKKRKKSSKKSLPSSETKNSKKVLGKMMSPSQSILEKD